MPRDDDTFNALNKIKMKVTLVGTAHPFRGGIAVFIERLAKAFQQNKDEVRISTFTLQYPKILFPGETQLSSSPKPTDLDITQEVNSINPFNWIKVGKQLKAQQPDLVIFKYWMPFMAPCFGTIAQFIKKNNKSKIISLVHNLVPHEKRPGDAVLTNYFAKKIDGFIAMSQSVLDDINKFNSVKPKSLSPHPLYDNFGAIKTKEEALRALDLDASFNYMLFFGIVRKYKGLDILLEAFAPESPHFEEDIHATAVIDKTVKLGKGCKIGANSYVGKNVVLGDNVTIYPNVSIFDDSTIGNETIIWSGTVIRERSKIGSHCIFHTNVSIGADGFGYRPSPDGRGLVKIVHIGNVVIGNAVEIGANSCIDRGKFSSTVLGDGCKIDNLVQIGHNCVLGRCCIMAGSSGLAGSVTLGDGVIIGGSASIKDHVTIHSGAKVGAGSGVIADVQAGKTVVGYPACDSREKMKQWVALRKLARN